MLLGCCLIGLVGCNHKSASAPQPSKQVAAGEIGSRLPEFSVKDLQGHPISSADLRGKAVLIDFWATWCQPCKKEMPGYQSLEDRYGPQGFVVIGFKFETMPDIKDPMQFAEEIGVHYPLAVATDDLKQKFGGIEGLPTTMLYDRHGVLRMKVIGFEYTDTFESALKPLLQHFGSTNLNEAGDRAGKRPATSRQ
jgi:thiol-disulfide isomerase/thioredoxin